MAQNESAAPCVAITGNQAWNQMIGIIGMSQNWMPNGGAAQTLAAVNFPSSTVMLCDKCNVEPPAGEAASSFDGNLNGWGPGPIITGVNWWDYSGSGGEMPNGTLPATADIYNVNGPNGAVTAVHQARANFVFADGHVKSMVPAATDPDPVKHPESDMWNAIRTQTSN